MKTCRLSYGLRCVAVAGFGATMLAGAAPLPHATDEIIFRAMSDELQRSVSQLQLEKYAPPFFVAYHLADARVLSIKATLGEIRQSQETPSRSHAVRLMVGNYVLNDENFVGSRSGSVSGGYLPLPLENDYTAIRRAFWILTDRLYKSSLERYDQKQAALKQQTKSESEKCDDFAKMPPTKLILPAVVAPFEKARWEQAARDISALFRPYDQIMSSTVYLLFVNASIYLQNNEGTQVKIPASAACLWINVFAQAEDGEPLTDHLQYCATTPDQLPPLEQIKQEAKGLADFILALRQAPVMADAYSGPVLFEGSAVAALVAEKLFGDDGLIANREPVYAVESGSRQGNINRLDAKFNQRVCANKITIKATPKLKTFNRIPLVGRYEVDAEGVVPKDELVLVEKGLLRSLLNDRVPTPKVREPNGHCRPAVARGDIAMLKAPGVIQVSYADGLSLAALRKKARSEAADNGLDAYYVVRKLQAQNPGMNREMYMAAARNSALSQPVALYRVAVKTGAEQLVRSGVFSDFPITNFKRILQGSKDQAVYNTLESAQGAELPVSFIVPQGLLFDDVSLEKVRITKPKPRPVPNPVVAQK